MERVSLQEERRGSLCNTSWPPILPAAASALLRLLREFSSGWNRSPRRLAVRLCGDFWMALCRIITLPVLTLPIVAHLRTDLWAPGLLADCMAAAREVLAPFALAKIGQAVLHGRDFGAAHCP
eukprot:SAG11_NODE_3295_length_2543_cov_2.392799_1_plen_123_part_00